MFRRSILYGGDKSTVTIMLPHGFLFTSIFSFYWSRLKILFKMGTDLNIGILLNLRRNNYQTSNEAMRKQQATLP